MIRHAEIALIQRYLKLCEEVDRWRAVPNHYMAERIIHTEMIPLLQALSGYVWWRAPQPPHSGQAPNGGDNDA